jgi:hypothetical protein
MLLPAAEAMEPTDASGMPHPCCGSCCSSLCAWGSSLLSSRADSSANGCNASGCGCSCSGASSRAPLAAGVTSEHALGLQQAATLSPPSLMAHRQSSLMLACRSLGDAPADGAAAAAAVACCGTAAPSKHSRMDATVSPADSAVRDALPGCAATAATCKDTDNV